MKTLNILVCFFMLACGAIPQKSFGSEVVYNIGAHKFSVPQKNIPDLSPWSWVKSIVGLDQNVDSFIFEFSGDEVKSHVGAYTRKNNSLDQKIIGAVYHVSQDEKERFDVPRKYSNLWYATNGYDSREVSFDERSGYYFVYEKKGYRGKFYVFSKPPEGELPESMDDFFVAICSGSSTTELRHVSCPKQFFIADDLLVDFSVSLGNLASLVNVVSFLRATFAEWKISQPDTKA
ncbi:hypothetical protein [Microbulbifer spongiae]|uniref:Uncharacterized protein n=1 Tax=Microbulbifer spongiae TaxID=2944933 RepID=A0ABY9EE96_9GAMM|nr:hypothetical protein [Microbulbifer sp. MI-G]WKD50582.1 hypothetical protein M8T91_03915 [Microbulbifer sp. MI-G]